MASENSQTLSSGSSSDLRPTGWDVFLSFRGADTRYKFTSHLYAALDRHGIRAFMDDSQLRNGDSISYALLQAIRESKTYIVVFSKNYAFSPWCLDELVEIFECHQQMRTLVIPLFYHIDPSVVRHQTQEYGQAFERHDARYQTFTEKLMKWRHTLREVASFSGIHITKTRSEADVITEIVDRILLEINPMFLDAGRYLIGMDSRVTEITTFVTSVQDADIRNGIDGVITLGVHGTGGVGKTTLAKCLYNKLFHYFKGRCFLANVGEVCKTTKGLVSLQQQLLNDVLKCKNINIDNVDQGIGLIRARVTSAKILLVIDDLGNPEQYKYLVGRFPAGSLVILTTRDDKILDQIEVESRYRYEINELDDAESLTLFSLHAFGKPEPDDSLMVLTRQILLFAGGLPLALEIFGSYLYKRTEVEWKHYIKKLQHSIHEGIGIE